METISQQQVSMLKKWLKLGREIKRVPKVDFCGWLREHLILAPFRVWNVWKVSMLGNARSQEPSRQL